ncbi:MAG: thiamine pyrophosphate-binding protein [Rhodospirillaceae bacterium]|jgi:acetolactate synthase I/II/III large subunit|nr:thiamine pyrophosphate-binding protein [Rhodospirillaceae bacterium]MBT5308035.1 thiamine pyrophosphate-binding protein [Rhodospirillaceae bacterium]MBT7355641.1 thiamine pyrophosphate-binding protein [Rhodospirillaceae bacterium]
MKSATAEQQDVVSVEGELGDHPRRMKGQEFLAELLRQSGTKAIFFVPTFLYPTLVELAEDSIKRVLCHSEKAAAYMADGYAQASGKPAVVTTQGGPGATNLYAGLVDAWQSNTPVLAVTPALPSSRYHGNSYQEAYVDFRPVTKYDAEVRSIDRMAEFFGKAYREMTTGAPRPVHLYLDGALESAEAEFDFRYLDKRYFSYPAFRPRADDELVEQAVRELHQAQSPVIVCGRGTVVSGAWEEITALAERLDVPVTTTLGGKGSIDERHSLALGVTGAYRRPTTDHVLEKADLVLNVGGHQGGATTNMKKLPKPGVRVIHIDINPAQPGANYPNVLPLVGDARTVLRQMLDVAQLEEQGTHSAWVAEAHDGLRAWRESERVHIEGNAVPIRPEQLMSDLVKACPENTLYVTDTGYAGTWAGAFMDLPAGKNFLHCEGSLGWAFPAAMGAKTAVPERTVVTITGDGGFFYHLTELETAVRNGINLVTVVLNNQAMAFQTHLLRSLWAGSRDLDKLSEFGMTNFADVARGMGAWGVQVTNPKDIAEAVRQAIELDVPAVVDVLIDPSAVAPVAVMAGQGSRSNVRPASAK